MTELFTSRFLDLDTEAQEMHVCECIYLRSHIQEAGKIYVNVPVFLPYIYPFLNISLTSSPVLICFCHERERRGSRNWDAAKVNFLWCSNQNGNDVYIKG